MEKTGLAFVHVCHQKPHLACVTFLLNDRKNSVTLASGFFFYNALFGAIVFM
jgi:hypothetical protein